jgi:hypothetical protein
MNKKDLLWDLEYLIAIKKDVTNLEEKVRNKASEDTIKDDLDMIWWKLTDVVESLTEEYRKIEE